MPILNRLSSLVFADVHAVLDKLEDPHTSLNMAVRDMEASLSGSAQEISGLKCSIENYRRRHAEHTQRLVIFDDELDVCFGSNEEDLAKIVLRKKLTCEQALSSIEKSIAALDHSLKREQVLFRENERRLSAMREKLELHAQEFESPFREAETFGGVCDAVSEEAVQVAFLKEQQRRKS